MFTFLLLCHSINNKTCTHRPKVNIVNTTRESLNKNYSKLVIDTSNTKNNDSDNIININIDIDDSTEDSTRSFDYTETVPTDKEYTIKDPEIYIPLIIACVLLISILIGTIICFKKYCPACLPCVLC